MKNREAEWIGSKTIGSGKDEMKQNGLKKAGLKNIMLPVLALVMGAAAGASAWAGAFDEYYDFEQTDGTYAYLFPRALVTLDEEWYQNTMVIVGDRGATFYHKDSYDAYAAEGLEGGRLFTLGASVNTDFQELPSFVYIGFDEEEAMNYYAELPSDYQAYMDDEEIRAEYDVLWSEVEDVIAGISIKGAAKGSDAPGGSAGTANTTVEEPVVVQPRIITSGDYKYFINDENDARTITIEEYTGDEEVIDIPSEIDGYQVTDIGYQAFTYKEMKSLSVPDSVKNIGQRAFEYCVISDEVQLPENVSIMSDAFSYAELPAVMTIPAGASVEQYAFSYCETIKQLLVETGAVIKDGAFGYCDGMYQLVCADGCRLEEDAFEYCEALGKVVLCGSVDVDEDAFSYCGKIDMVEAEESDFAIWKDEGAGKDETGKDETGKDETGKDETGKDESGDNTSGKDTLSGRMLGGWELTEDISITEEARDVFAQAIQNAQDNDYVDYEAVGLLGTQVVRGTIYCFLCRTGVTDTNVRPSYLLVYIWQDIDGSAEVLKIQEIEFGL